MSEFDLAMKFVLKNEGGLSESVCDSGGMTNFGISLRFLRDVPRERLRRYSIFEEVDENTIRALALDQAKLIYKEEFWEGNQFEQINNQTLCNYIFDMAVSHGVANAVRMVQRSVWASTWTRNYIRDDGLMGMDTLDDINAIDANELISILIGMRSEYYRCIASNKPKDDLFLDGWLNRCYNMHM